MRNFLFFCMMLLFAAGFVFTAGPVRAEEAPVARYAVYAGGIRVGVATLDFNRDPQDQYKMVVRAWTTGLLDRLFSWQGNYETHGHLDSEGRFVPRTHVKTQTAKGETEQEKLVFDDLGRVQGFLEKDDSDPEFRARNLDAEAARDSADVITAVFDALRQTEESGTCNVQSTAFDGKRRFHITLTDRGTEKLHESRYNFYSGSAQRCTLQVERAGGKWRNKDKARGWMAMQQQSHESDAPVTLWIAREMGSGFAVPVKMHLKTRIGSVMMHLTGFEPLHAETECGLQACGKNAKLDQERKS